MRREAARLDRFEAVGGEARRSAAAAEARESHVIRFDRGRHAFEASRLIGLVAAARGVPPLLIVHRSRCTAEVAAARQLAMYLMHVGLGRTLTTVGRCFGRDRTTVAHACAQIEDRRDDPGFDAEVTRLEAAIASRDRAHFEEARHVAR